LVVAVAPIAKVAAKATAPMATDDPVTQPNRDFQMCFMLSPSIGCCGWSGRLAGTHIRDASHRRSPGCAAARLDPVVGSHRCRALIRSVRVHSHSAPSTPNNRSHRSTPTAEQTNASADYRLDYRVRGRSVACSRPAPRTALAPLPINPPFREAAQRADITRHLRAQAAQGRLHGLRLYRASRHTVKAAGSNQDRTVAQLSYHGSFLTPT